MMQFMLKYIKYNLAPRITEFFGQRVSARTNSGMMELIFFFIGCLHNSRGPKSVTHSIYCEKNPVYITVSKNKVNLSLTLSNRHLKTITYFHSNFKHAHSDWEPTFSGKMTSIIPESLRALACPRTLGTKLSINIKSSIFSR